MCVCVCVCVVYISGEGNGNPLQYSCLENFMDGGTSQATVPRVAKSWTWLSDFTFVYVYTHTHTHTSSSFSQSHVWLFVTPWTAAHQVPLSSIISKSWLNFMSIELVININIHAYICVCVCVCIQTYIHIYFIKSYRNIDYICMVYILKSITVLYVVSTMYW